MGNDDFQVFVSYARPDRAQAEEIYDWLTGEGFTVWIDSKKIKPGQNWDFEIKKALDRSSIVLILWSNNSIDRRGYVQRELKISLDKLQEKLLDDIFIIPICLNDDLEIPPQLQGIQNISIDTPGYKEAIADAINHQIERLGGEIKRIQREEEIFWIRKLKKEIWDGLPGYEFEAQLLEFRSERYGNIQDINTYIHGKILELLFDSRKIKLDQSIEYHNYAQDKWARTNTFDAMCDDPIISGKILSINYIMSWYGAGAAHPTHGHKTYNFLLEPLIAIDSIEKIFKNPDVAFHQIQDEIRRELYNYKPWGDDEVDSNSDPFLDKEWVDRGINEWADLSAFVFNKETLDFFFSSYQVAPYAAGTPQVSLSYSKVAKLMREEFVTALSLHGYVYGLRE